MTYRRGAWYLLGLDRDKAEPRMFKVARVDAVAERIGKPGSYAVPELDLEAAWASLEPSQPDAEVVLAIRTGRAPDLRRRGRSVEPEQEVPAGYEALAVSYARAGDLVGEVCAHGADVVVLAPAAVRRAVRTELRAIARSGS